MDDDYSPYSASLYPTLPSYSATYPPPAAPSTSSLPSYTYFDPNDPASFSSSTTSEKTPSARRLAELELEFARRQELEASLAAAQAQSILSPSARKLQELEAKYAALQASVAAPAPARVPEPTPSERKLAELERQYRELSAATNSAAASATMSPSARKVLELEEQLRKLTGKTAAAPPKTELELLQEETERAQRQTELESARRKAASTHSRRAALEDSIRDLEMKVSSASHAGASDATIRKAQEYEIEKQMLQERLSGMTVTSGQIASARERLEARQYGIDLALIVDLTGSMEPWIEEVKEKVIHVMNEAAKIPLSFGRPQAKVRIAFVGYRDHDHGNQRIVYKDFAESDSDMRALQSFIASQEAIGGEDTCEDVTGGLHKAKSLSWKSSTKLIVHIGDAPCHGGKFHRATEGDNYPQGDPLGIDPLAIMKWLGDEDINYFFGEINNSTKIMIDLFRIAFRGGRPTQTSKFEVLPSGEDASKFVNIVLKSVTMSVKK